MNKLTPELKEQILLLLLLVAFATSGILSLIHCKGAI